MRVYSSWVPPNQECEIFRDLGIGIVFTPRARRSPLDGIPWILDNGAFGSWIRKTSFDSYRFLRSLRLIPRDHHPDFIVIPDIVAGGRLSFEFSLRWMKRIGTEFKRYFAVQNGMTYSEIETVLNLEIDGLFIGGTIEWKINTAGIWIELAHDHGKPAHIGRCGPISRIKWAKRIGADSIDSGSWARNGNRRKTLIRVKQIAESLGD